MKKITIKHLTTICFSAFMLLSLSSYSQVFYSESWTDAGPGLAGWTNAGTGGNFVRATGATVCDGAGARANIFSAGNIKQFISPSLGTSAGGLTTFTFDYKVAVWSANTVGAPGTDFTIDVEWTNDLAGTWINLGQINSGNHVVSGNCAQGPGTYQFTPNVGDQVYVRFVITRLAGDNYYNFDNISVSEPVTLPPNCDASLTATTEVSVAGNISWSAATGAPNAYDLTVGTTSGGSDVLATTDVGNVTTFNLGTLLFSTTYYVTIVPKNDNGSAAGCIEQTFVTKAPPTIPTVDVVFDIDPCGDSDTYNVAYDVNAQPFVWVQLNYVGGCDSLTIDTEGGDFDSEIGLYDSNGLLIGNDDDGGSGNLSSLTLTGLPAGIYYIVGGTFNTVFGADDFAVSTTNTTRTGTIFINASTPSNETADFVNLQFPFEATIVQGNTATVFAQIFESGITEPAGQGAGIQAWIGVSNTNASSVTDFETVDWTWVPATYNVDNGNNDEYQAAIGTGLNPGTYYYVSRFSVLGGPFAYGGINPGSSDGNFWDGINFVSGELTVTPPPPPANDDCQNAIALTPGAIFTDNPMVGSNVGATASEVANPSIPAPGCASYSGGDAWYSVVVPSDGNITVETNANPTGSGGDSGMALYSGDCNNLVLIECDDDDSPDGLFSLVTIANPALAGQTIYVRVWEFGNNADLNFQVSAYSATLSVGDLDIDSNFTFYPNPVKDTFTLTAQNTIEQVTVFNMLGQAVLKLAPNATSSDVDMSSLNSGTYFAQVTVNNVVKTVKVVKQ